MNTGWRSHFDPCRAFSTEHYLSAYPDIREAGINPLLHFLESGWQENRQAFSESGHLNELVGYQRGKLISLGARPLDLHLEWTACNRLAGWVANIQSDNRKVDISGDSGLIGVASVQKPSPSSGDMTYSHFEFYLESPISPVSAKFIDVNNQTEITLASEPLPEPGYASVEEFLQRPISPDTTAVAPCSRQLIKEFIKEKRELVAISDAAKDQTTMASIVMPVFNRESLVASAITSVAKQRYTNWELIIVDDGSTDKSLDVVKQTIKTLNIESKTTVITLEENAGVSHARNRGLAVARGPIIAYLDSDNSWDRDYLSLITAAFKKNPDIDSVYTGQYVYFFNEVLQRRYLAGIRIQPFNRKLLEQENYIDLNIFAHRKKLYDQMGGFNEQMRRLVDWDLILKYTREQEPLLIPALLAQYNSGIAENQITQIEDFQ
ncbi:MAG: glycosyltransferase family A protein, partial [Pseudomonadales bacterium]